MASEDDHAGDSLDSFWSDLRERAKQKGMTYESWAHRAQLTATDARYVMTAAKLQRWAKTRSRISDWDWMDIRPVVRAAVGDDTSAWQRRWARLQARTDRRAGRQPTVSSPGETQSPAEASHPPEGTPRRSQPVEPEPSAPDPSGELGDGLEGTAGDQPPTAPTDDRVSRVGAGLARVDPSDPETTSTTPPRAARPAATALRPWSRYRRQVVGVALMVAILALVTSGGVGRRGQPPMPADSFNVAVAPFAVSGSPSDVERSAARQLAQGVFARLSNWPDRPGVLIRGPDQTSVISGGEKEERIQSFNRMAIELNADVIVTGIVQPAGNGTITIIHELFLGGRTLAEVPEFIGLHRINVTRPVDMFLGNLELNKLLAEDLAHQAQGVSRFVRGLSHYGLDRFSSAEEEFKAAEQEFRIADQLRGPYLDKADKREVLYLMIGNAVGKEDAPDPVRRAEATRYYERALIENPSYLRAQIGLAEIARIGAGCRPEGHADPRALQQAVDRYGAVLTQLHDGHEPTSTLLEMKVRLGLGLVYQCVSYANLDNRWQYALEEFDDVVHLWQTARLSDNSARQAQRLASEARAGQGLILALTVDQQDEAGNREAAAALEEAIEWRKQISTGWTDFDRQQRFLCNLQPIYERLNDAVKSKTPVSE